MLQELSTFASGSARPRVALLIDGDNISHDQAGRILTRTGQYGEVIIRRVYGNAALRPGWLAAAGFHFRQAGTGKNAADLLLSVEAMDLMLTNRADLLVIASSDRDFTHLATHLRELGRVVIGIGEIKAPEAYRKSCSKFVELPPVTPVVPDSAVMPAAKPQQTTIELQAIVLVRAAGNAGLPLADLAVRMNLVHKVLISQQGQKTWRAWLDARPALFDCDPRGLQARVRLKAQA